MSTPEPPVSARATGSVQTSRSQRYLDQLCKHFSHRAQAELQGPHCVVIFDDGRLDASAQPGALVLELTSSSPEHLARLEDVIKSHLERWGEADQLVVQWGPAAKLHD
jgi:uncharacterized protein